MVYDFFNTHITCIEVKRDNKIFLQYFPKLPHCEHIDNIIKSGVLDKLQRKN